ncbi:MAG: sulfite exporter TauE/SafE family protein [bacterium]|nr:sulfite exporter TauE/SafE family protein [bacterium]
MEFDLYHLGPIALSAFVVGFFKTTFSMGTGILLVPILVLWWPARFVMGVISVIMWSTDFVTLPMFWRKWEGRLVRLMVPGFVIGIFIGTTLLVNIPEAAFRRVIGAGALIFAGIQAWGEVRGGLPTPRVGTAAGLGLGILGGTTSALTHSGGLVLSLFYLSQGLEKTAVVASIIATWVFVNPVKVISFWVAGIVNLKIFIACVAAVPLAFLGGWIGKHVLQRLSQRAFNLSLLCLAFVAGLRLLLG